MFIGVNIITDIEVVKRVSDEMLHPSGAVPLLGAMPSYLPQTGIVNELRVA
jgi:hypothetical protein